MSRDMRLRVLVVSPCLPYPPIWGSGVRVLQLLRHLAKRHRLSLLTYAWPSDGPNIAAVQELGVSVYSVPAPRSQGRGRRQAQFMSLFSSASYQWRGLRSETMQDAIDRLLDKERFDLIQVETSQMCGFDFASSAVVLLDEHNIEYELLSRMYHSERSPVRKLYSGMEYLKFRREEQRAWGRVAGCILTSEREEAIFRRSVPTKPVAVVPNGVDVEEFCSAAKASDDANIVFTGMMRYRPNVDGVLYFVHEVLPRIRRVRSDVTFSIVGANEPKEVRRLAGPHVVVTGWVPDVRPYVERAAVFAVPLRMGGGTRLKVLEGLAMGKAMVSTTLGCEGIKVRDGQHLLIADEPSAFAEAVLRLLDDRSLAAALGENGRNLAESEYSWASVAQQLEAFYSEVLGGVQPRQTAPALRTASDSEFAESARE